MKRKNKGRKIYKTKEKNYYGKTPMGKFLSGALTVLLIGGIGFLGYSVAEPIINYTQHKGDEPDAQEPTSEPVLLEKPSEAPTTVPVTEAPTEPPTEAHEPFFFTAAALGEDDILSSDDLKNALEVIPKDAAVEFIAVPLKSGGLINYNSSLIEPITSGAVMSELTLDEIKTEIEKHGFKAAAYVSIFNDNVMPLTYPETGYVNSNDGTLWIDRDEKTWTSPYSQKALNINAEIINEITAAGFETVICSDLVFPDFTEDDLLVLDPVLGQNDRCISMTSAANLFNEKAVANGSSMQTEVSVVDILKGKTDVLQPALLSSNNFVLSIDLDELSDGLSIGDTQYEFSGTPAENIRQCLDLVSDKLIGCNVTLRLSGKNYSYSELFEAKNSIADYDFRAYVIG